MQAGTEPSQIAAPGAHPRRGDRLRDFGLTAASGQHVRISDYRGRRNLVLVFAGDCENASRLALLAEIAHRYPEFVEQEAEVLAVVAGTRQQAELVAKRQPLPFPLLIDAENQAHRFNGAVDSRGRPAPAVYITDRYGEVFAVFRTQDAQTLPSADEALGWLEFVNIQCPECFPPEWPPV